MRNKNKQKQSNKEVKFNYGYVMGISWNAICTLGSHWEEENWVHLLLALLGILATKDTWDVCLHYP